MSDEEFLRKVNAVLEALWNGHQKLVLAHMAYSQAGEAFRDEAEGLGREPFRSLRRAVDLRQAVEKPRKQVEACQRSQEKTRETLDKLLRAWEQSPGERYIRFVDQARRLRDSYSRDAAALAPAAERIQVAIEAFDRWLRER